MTVTEIRDKYQSIVNAESAMLHGSPFKGQIMKAQDEQYIKYTAMSNAMYAFRYSQKGRIVKWLSGQLTQYLNDAIGNENAGVRQLSQWSAQVVEVMIEDLRGQ